MTYQVDLDKSQLRRSLIPDTNVVYAFFDKGDNLHAEASWLFDQIDRNWIVLTAVAVETWGLFSRSNLEDDLKLRFLTWLITPGKVIYLDAALAPIKRCNEICLARRVDLVDAIIVESAHSLSTILGGRQNEIPIVAADSDFWRLREMSARNLRVYDIRSELEEIERLL